MSLILISVIVILALLVRLVFRKKDSNEYEKVIDNLPMQGNGWIEIVDTNFQPLIYGKILYSHNLYVGGVGVLVKDHLPAALALDIDAKTNIQFLDDSPLCRFLIDCQGREVILTELKNEQLKEKLTPYVDAYSEINLMVALDSQGFVLIDNKAAESDFEWIWQETKGARSLN